MSGAKDPFHCRAKLGTTAARSHNDSPAVAPATPGERQNGVRPRRRSHVTHAGREGFHPSTGSLLGAKERRSSLHIPMTLGRVMTGRHGFFVFEFCGFECLWDWRTAGLVGMFCSQFNDAKMYRVPGNHNPIIFEKPWQGGNLWQAFIDFRFPVSTRSTCNRDAI